MVPIYAKILKNMMSGQDTTKSNLKVAFHAITRRYYEDGAMIY